MLSNNLITKNEPFLLSSAVEKLLSPLVIAGQYEEYRIPDLECFSGNGKDIVISSFVRGIRMDEAQGNFKLNVLLEELMMAEESEGTLMFYLYALALLHSTYLPTYLSIYLSVYCIAVFCSYVEFD